MAISNITASDATTPTPVVHTFVPVMDGPNAKYINDAGAFTLKGQETLGFEIKRATDNRSANTARLTMWDPVEVQAVDGTYSVSHGNSFDLRFNYAQAATLQKRLDLVTIAINVLTAKKADLAGLVVQF